MKKSKLEKELKAIKKRVSVIEGALTDSVTEAEGHNKIKESMPGTPQSAEHNTTAREGLNG